MLKNQIKRLSREGGGTGPSWLIERLKVGACFPVFISLMFFTLLLGMVLAAPVRAETILTVTNGNSLLMFDSATPGTVSATPILGLQVGESILGIDFRPATGQLFGLSSASRLYIINPATGVATQRGTDGEFTLEGDDFGFDFNPVPDRIRVVSDEDQNLRLNPNDGTLTSTDGTIAYADGDDNEGADPNVVGSAYANNIAGTDATTLYGIDSNLNILVIQNPPNDGILNTVGTLGVDSSDLLGFDIVTADSDTAFAALTVGGLSQLYTINLTTGAATLVGNISTGATAIQGLAVVPPTVTLFALTTENDLLQFNSGTPDDIISTTSITGLQSGEDILGMDSRPATGQLFGLGNTNRLYTINPTTGAATQVGSDGQFTLVGTAFGFDFNPVPDRIRVVSDDDQNLRLNPNDGTLTMMDTVLAYAVGDTNEGEEPNIVGSAYANNIAGVTTTTLFGIDSDLDILVMQDPPNDGILNTVGSLGVDISDLVGFDIRTASPDTAFAALTAPAATASQLYTINLTTGSATLVGTIGDGMETIRGLSAMIVPAPSPSPTPTPTVSPTPTPGDDDNGCSIATGTVKFGQAAANILIPLTPLFAIGLRMLRRKRK